MNMKMWLYLKKAEIGMSKERRYTLDAVTRLAVKRSPAEISEIKEKYCKNKLICEGTELTDAEEYIFQLMEAASREQAIPSRARRKAKEMKGGKNAKRIKGGGQKLKDSEFDKKLANWIREMRAKKLRVTRKMIQCQVIVMWKDDEDFLHQRDG